jgi:hypothetical protein
VVHPTLGRAAFLLDPDGVKLHWLTSAQYERTGLTPDNATIEKDCRRGGKLPLKPDAWNSLKMSITANTLSLTLNDTLIYERKIETEKSRHFGLFHYAGDEQVRVRNVLYQGNWPRTLPPLAEQELAGEK